MYQTSSHGPTFPETLLYVIFKKNLRMNGFQKKMVRNKCKVYSRDQICSLRDKTHCGKIKIRSCNFLDQ